MASDKNNIKLATLEYNNLYSEVCDIIDSTRQQLAAAFTNMQLLMYWSIGRTRQTLWGGCTDANLKTVAKRYMIEKKLVPLQYES